MGGFDDFVTADDMQNAWTQTRALLPRSIMINTSYCEAVCAPTRSTLMLGRWRHQMKDGYSWGGVSSKEEIALPLKLRVVGYKTYMVGKWHVGSATWKQLPEGRGFHRYYGRHGNGDQFLSCTRKDYDNHYAET